jgi:acyl-CoA synthetase (AMP-forming)/AMP-acid ligase II
MIFTSGTTADPKACQLSHAGLQRAWRTYVRTVAFLPGEKIWVPMPFFHSGGIGLLTCMTEVGGTLATSPHFDPGTVMRLVNENRIEHLYPGFHTLGLPVLSDPAYDRESCNFVRSMVCVGPTGTQRRLQAMLPDHAPIMNLFGMSESAGLLLLADADAEPELRLEAAGRPPRGVGIRIIDPETGREQPPGISGEIQFRGGGAFLGYYKNPKVTQETIIDGGWVRTGDLGRVDANGWLTFLGRLKDMLKVGGENVAAAEIESFLSAHPAIKFVQVVGKPDDRMGELPVAFVELNPGCTVDQEDIVRFCTGKIARYKIPAEVHVVTEWPMSATKVQKFKLRELLKR